jgi:plasmid maintenance system antidote protein VapI
MALTRTQLRELREHRVPPGANRVAKAMALAEVKQIELAAAIEVPQPYVSDVVRSRYRDITLGNAFKFAVFFGCAVEDLFPWREAA